MDVATSFWNKIQLPSFMAVLWSKITGSASAADGPRKLDAGQKPAAVPNCHLVTSQADLSEFCDFLRQFYNTSTNVTGPAPISTLTPVSAKVKNLRPIILRLPDRSAGGVISSQPIGTICWRSGGGGSNGGSNRQADFPLRLISNFCVHPTYRKKALGSQLLNAVWHDLLQLGEDACIFLKEGQPLLTAGPALVAGRWVYRYCPPTNDRQVGSTWRQIHTVADVAADRLIESYIVENPNALFNKGISENACRTLLYEYKGLRGSILAAFTPADQVHSLNGRPIYYQTGWLERGNILLTERLMAAKAISDYIGVASKGAWVWCDISIINGTVSAPWKLDGPYYYYAFQWTANLYGSAKLFLRL